MGRKRVRKGRPNGTSHPDAGSDKSGSQRTIRIGNQEIALATQSNTTSTVASSKIHLALHLGVSAARTGWGHDNSRRQQFRGPRVTISFGSGGNFWHDQSREWE